MGLNPALFTELGLPLWQARPGYFSQRSSPEQQTESNIELETASTEVESSHLSSENADAITNGVAVSKVQPWVWVGAGLAEIWQNPQRPEWQLTLNILQAFDRTPNELHFVDSSLCQSEAAVMDALDVIIALGVEHVFVFERNSPLIEDLQAGAELIDLPNFQQLFSAAEAKQALYQLLCQATNNG